MARLFKIAFSISIIVFYTSCASLTKTQLKGINSYAQVLEKFSDYPGTIVKGFVQLKYETGQLNTGTIVNNAIVTESLWKSYYGKDKALKEAEKLDLSIQIIGEYAAALAKLSSTDLSDSIQSGSLRLGSNMSQLITEYNAVSNDKISINIGALVAKSIAFFGTRYTKNKQAKDLKAFIHAGDPLVTQITESIKKDLEKVVLEKWIPGLKDELKTRHQNFLSNMPPKAEYRVYLANSYNKEVAEIIARIDHLEKITAKTIAAVDHIRKAHKELLVCIQQKKKLKEVLVETQAFYVSVRGIYKEAKM